MLIEFCGTPSSGKSSTIQGFNQSGAYIPFTIIEESMLRCPFDDSNFALGVLWTIFDTYAETKRVTDDISSKNGLTVFDRGLIDRIAFARLLSTEDKRYSELADRAEKWLRNSKQLLFFDKIFLFLTTYEKARERKINFKLRENSEFRIINPIIIPRLNTIYLELFAELKNELPIVLIDDINGDLSLEQKMLIVSNHINGENFSD